MKFLVVGGGSIGKRHMRNLLAMGIDPSDIGSIDIREDRREEIKELLKIEKVFRSIEDALESGTYDAGIVCSPTSLHIPHGTLLAEKGINILMEKPLAHNLDGIDKFKQLVEQNDIIVLMAYIFRFSPLTKKTKEILDSGAIGKILSVRGEFSEYLPDWHPYEDYRSFYMAKKSMGGGSILDQSHIMDLIHYLVGGFTSVFAVNTKISNLEIEADDIAEMIVILKNGVIASIHTDIFGRDHRKLLEIKGENGNILWNCYKNEVRQYLIEDKSAKIYHKFPMDFNLNYLEQIRHFIACCEGKEKPIADLQTGIETMKLIKAAEKSQQTKRVEKVS